MESGHYEVSALSDANYTGTCFTGSSDVRVCSVPPTSVISGDATLCEGDYADIPIVFTGSAPWKFTYTKDGLNPTTIITVNNPYVLKVTEAGQYEVISLEGGGCSGTIMSGRVDILVNPLPTATITNGNGQILINSGETTELTVALTGTPPWNITYTVDDLNPTSILDIDETPYMMQVSEEGTYEVKEVSDVYCSNTLSLGYPEVVYKSVTVSSQIKILGLGNQIKIYPNPTNGRVTLEYSNSSLSDIRIEILSLSGMKMLSLVSKERHFNQTVDLSQLSGGLYFVRVVSGSKVYVGKLIISD